MTAASPTPFVSPTLSASMTLEGDIPILPNTGNLTPQVPSPVEDIVAEAAATFAMEQGWPGPHPTWSDIYLLASKQPNADYAALYEAWRRPAPQRADTYRQLFQGPAEMAVLLRGMPGLEQAGIELGSLLGTPGAFTMQEMNRLTRPSATTWAIARPGRRVRNEAVTLATTDRLWQSEKPRTVPRVLGYIAPNGIPQSALIDNLTDHIRARSFAGVPLAETVVAVADPWLWEVRPWIPDDWVVLLQPGTALYGVSTLMPTDGGIPELLALRATGP